MAQLSPAELDRVEEFWRTRGSAWHFDRLAPTSWERVRVRPANHPLVRLGMAAALLTSSFEGLTAAHRGYGEKRRRSGSVTDGAFPSW